MPSLLALVSPDQATHHHHQRQEKCLTILWRLFLDRDCLLLMTVGFIKIACDDWKEADSKAREISYAETKVKIWSTFKIEFCQTVSWAPAMHGLTMTSKATCANSYKHTSLIPGIFMAVKVLKALYYLTINVTVHRGVFLIIAVGGEEFKGRVGTCFF